MVARYGIALLLASAVTFGLFYLMQSLVVDQDAKLGEDDSVRLMDIVQPQREEKVQQKEREVEKPPEVKDPPPEMKMEVNTDVSADAGLGNFDADVRVDTQLSTGAIGAPTDGEYLPIVKVPAQYPRRAQERGVEGWVMLEFTVTKQGTVTDISVIDADPKGYFERAAKRAAAKWKYKPKVVNGQPIAVTGVQHKVTFEMADGGRR
ncbi:hypothetical protein CCR85_00845 [Rhodothalassium salexigens]|nr:hypothetical protein [Rhodothalassium salexigens DSM 2132]MBK5910040.1 hypothetical protein [Rhodothalassium salexigens]MBK5921551.1 hypothetical protein [Rhodothalassium salexigens]